MPRASRHVPSAAVDGGVAAPAQVDRDAAGDGRAAHARRSRHRVAVDAGLELGDVDDEVGAGVRAAQRDDQPVAAAQAVGVLALPVAGGDAQRAVAHRGRRPRHGPARTADDDRRAVGLGDPLAREGVALEVGGRARAPGAGRGLPALTPAMRVSRFAPCSTNQRSPAEVRTGESVRLRRAAGRRTWAVRQLSAVAAGVEDAERVAVLVGPEHPCRRGPR